MVRNLVPTIVLAAALSACSLQSEVLNSERIENRFGNYGVEIIEQDLADGRTLGVRKTPQFFVHGRPLVNFGYRQLQSLVDTEVAKQYPQ